MDDNKSGRENHQQARTLQLSQRLHHVPFTHKHRPQMIPLPMPESSSCGSWLPHFCRPFRSHGAEEPNIALPLLFGARHQQVLGVVRASCQSIEEESRQVRRRLVDGSTLGILGQSVMLESIFHPSRRRFKSQDAGSVVSQMTANRNAASFSVLGSPILRITCIVPTVR